jgi:hypothetical protein
MKEPTMKRILSAHSAGQDTRTPMAVCHANIEPFIGIRLIAHQADPKTGYRRFVHLESPILSSEDEAREWAQRNGYYITKFYDHR